MWQNGKISAKMINATLSCADANAGWWHLISTFGIKMPSNIKEAIDRIGFFGAHTVILGWYENEDIVRRELEEITTAMNNGDVVYRLQYYTDIKITAFGTASRK